MKQNTASQKPPTLNNWQLNEIKWKLNAAKQLSENQYTVIQDTIFMISIDHRPWETLTHAINRNM